MASRKTAYEGQFEYFCQIFETMDNRDLRQMVIQAGGHPYKVKEENVELLAHFQVNAITSSKISTAAVPSSGKPAPSTSSTAGSRGSAGGAGAADKTNASSASSSSQASGSASAAVSPASAASQQLDSARASSPEVIDLREKPQEPQVAAEAPHAPPRPVIARSEKDEHPDESQVEAKKQKSKGKKTAARKRTAASEDDVEAEWHLRDDSQSAAPAKRPMLDKDKEATDSGETVPPRVKSKSGDKKTPASHPRPEQLYDHSFYKDKRRLSASKGDNVAPHCPLYIEESKRTDGKEGYNLLCHCGHHITAFELTPDAAEAKGVNPKFRCHCKDIVCKNCPVCCGVIVIDASRPFDPLVDACACELCRCQCDATHVMGNHVDEMRKAVAKYQKQQGKTSKKTDAKKEEERAEQESAEQGAEVFAKLLTAGTKGDEPAAVRAQRFLSSAIKSPRQMMQDAQKPRAGAAANEADITALLRDIRQEEHDSKISAEQSAALETAALEGNSALLAIRRTWMGGNHPDRAEFVTSLLRYYDSKLKRK